MKHSDNVAERVKSIKVFPVSTNPYRFFVHIGLLPYLDIPPPDLKILSETVSMTGLTQ